MPHPHNSATVLLVSPSPEDHDAIRRIFNSSGHFDWSIRFARTCQEAWLLLRKQGLDLVLTECDFPDGPSWRDLLGELADLPAFPPVIVMSHSADQRLWAEVLNLGGYDLLLKPLDGDETTRVVEMALRQAQNARRRMAAVA